MYDETGSGPGTLPASTVTTKSATWLATTKPKVQPPRRTMARMASSCGFQRQRSWCQSD